MKKAEYQRIDAFELWCWRRLLRVPWTARRSNPSILKISPGISLEGMMLKLKLQYKIYMYFIPNINGKYSNNIYLEIMYKINTICILYFCLLCHTWVLPFTMLSCTIKKHFLNLSQKSREYLVIPSFCSHLGMRLFHTLLFFFLYLCEVMDAK